MINEFISNVAGVIKDKDIQKLAVEGAENLFLGLVAKDITAIPTVAKNTKEIILSVPNIIFADKMYRFLTKAFSDYEMQIKFAARFNRDDPKYYDTVKKIVQIVDKIDFDEKIEWFANLTRAVCLECIDIDKYIKLSTAVSMLTVEDLKALKYYYGRTDEIENPTLSNYYSYGLTTKITPTTYKTLTSKHTLSTSGVELLKYGVDFDNCESYQIPINEQDGESE